MADEAYRYGMVERFRTVSLVESLTYMKGDLYRPHFSKRPLDRGVHYRRSRPPIPRQQYDSVDEALITLQLVTFLVAWVRKPTPRRPRYVH